MRAPPGQRSLSATLELDPAAHTARNGAAALDLTAKEFALLEYFMRHPGQALTRSRLIEHVWDYAYQGDSNVVDVYVGRLRTKLGGRSGGASLETVRGVGYRLREDARRTRRLGSDSRWRSPRGWPSCSPVSPCSST